MKKKNFLRDNPDGGRFAELVFALAKDIRYVALYRNGKLASVSRPNIGGASSWESDKYEEIIVNPTVVTLLRQRGEIDCGGMRYVIVRYGNFTQYIRPVVGGHLSVSFEPGGNYDRILPKIERLLTTQNLAVDEWDSESIF